MRKWISVAVVTSAAVAAGVTLIVTSAGGAANGPSGYQRPSQQAIKAVTESAQATAGSGQAYAIVICCGTGLVFSIGFQDIQQVGDGTWCFQLTPKKLKVPAIPTLILPLNGPGAVAWDLTSSGCPSKKYYKIVAYDLPTGNGAEWLSFGIWIP